LPTPSSVILSLALSFSRALFLSWWHFLAVVFGEITAVVYVCFYAFSLVFFLCSLVGDCFGFLFMDEGNLVMMVWVVLVVVVIIMMGLLLMVV
jgi:hypothetical protein